MSDRLLLRLSVIRIISTETDRIRRESPLLVETIGACIEMHKLIGKILVRLI